MDFCLRAIVFIRAALGFTLVRQGKGAESNPPFVLELKSGAVAVQQYILSF